MGKKPHSNAPVVRSPTGALAKGGGSLNPGGVPKWRREFAEAFGERCAPKAEQVLNRILDRALDIAPLEKALESEDLDTRLAAEKRISERMGQAGAAADTVLKYVLPKPKQELAVTVDDKREAFAGLTTAELAELAKRKPEPEE